MAKKKLKKSDRSKAPRQSRGRHEQPSRAELEDRYRALRLFFAGEWYRLGYALSHAQSHEDIIRVLTPVLEGHGNPILRKHMGRLLKNSDAKPTAKSIRALRLEFHQRSREDHALHIEYQEKWRALNEAQAAQASAKALLKAAASRIAPAIGAEKMKQKIDELLAARLNALKRRNEVQEHLQREEAAFARREILNFIADKDKRRAKTPENFSKAMAGLPENGWFSSFRKCNEIRCAEPAPITLTVFGVLREFCARIGGKTEEEAMRALRAAILNLPEAQNAEKEYLVKNWFFLADTIKFLWKSPTKPSDEELPHVLATRFFDAPRPQWKTFLANQEKSNLSANS